MRPSFVLLILAAGACGDRSALVGSDGPGAPTSTGSAVRPVPTGTGAPDASVTPPHGPPDASPPQICGDVTGRWAGTWKTQSGLTGTWETQFVESAGGALSGTSVVSGTVCGTTSKVVGKRGGCSINFGLSTFGACTVEFSGTLAGDTMSGTFTVTAGTSDQGQWNGARVH